MRLERLGTERDPRHPGVSQGSRQVRRHGLGVCLDRQLARRRQRLQKPDELVATRERGSAAAEKDRVQRRCKRMPLERKLCEQRVDVAGLSLGPTDDGHEVAVPAAVSAERQVDVEMPNVAHDRESRSPSRFSTARNASWGTSTEPSWRMRFLPSFWRSSSLRLRLMSPP